MTDITTDTDIKTMVNNFYLKVRKDELLGPVFNSKIQNWDEHLPTMYKFWETLMFGKASYKGRPFPKHLPLDINGTHFAQWIALFCETVDENFKGEKAEEAKMRARSIAKVFQFKMETIKGV
ncbi:group III truncated hemoglobin [Flexithrix dorotheae]|uniref:group III truncated hemoglobin n=1 Tax=Flexithrix dorotheae TaxID=70993 RepID=UPI00037CCA46|nr:group III truncated hemoglobin [Flexithrix dorotheae]